MILAIVMMAACGGDDLPGESCDLFYFNGFNGEPSKGYDQLDPVQPCLADFSDVEWVPLSRVPGESSDVPAVIGVPTAPTWAESDTGGLWRTPAHTWTRDPGSHGTVVLIEPYDPETSIRESRCAWVRCTLVE